ncbi:hypothetical protein CIRG_05582 [Coccidioides immitis RMSCC 2394]|uniref:Uncharacterized protein n=1 Tax=Coccidioides immitis RMSCC 2394 TaxID=404692 RepID=A0A0J6YAZ6_COCIT|nr:hypothetical protein CIRG_05582 [Coccidioides immitis RMSCC 2394]
MALFSTGAEMGPRDPAIRPWDLGVETSEDSFGAAAEIASRLEGTGTKREEAANRAEEETDEEAEEAEEAETTAEREETERPERPESEREETEEESRPDEDEVEEERESEVPEGRRAERTTDEPAAEND